MSDIAVSVSFLRRAAAIHLEPLLRCTLAGVDAEYLPVLKEFGYEAM
jgi:hypothetical protein